MNAMPTKESSVPVVEGLFIWPSEAPQLLAGHCSECQCYFFPSHAQLHRPGCSGGTVEITPLLRRGTIRSYTIQHYPPPDPYVAPDPFEPFVLVTVEFPEGLQIPGQLVGVAADYDEIVIGQAVDVVIAPLYTDEHGVTRLTWKFDPVAASAATA